MTDSTTPQLRQRCSGGSCRQGRRDCETPAACHVPWTSECEREMNDWRKAALDVLKVVGAVFACAIVAAILTN